MHLIAELDQRLAQMKMLLQLEEEHLQRVRERNLDDSDARWLIEMRRRYLGRLEEQRSLIVHRRLLAHKAHAHHPDTDAESRQAEDTQSLSMQDSTLSGAA